MDSWYDMEEDKAYKQFMSEMEEAYLRARNDAVVKAYRDYVRKQKEKQVKTILNKWKNDRLHNNRNNRDGVDSLRP